MSGRTATRALAVVALASTIGVVAAARASGAGAEPSVIVDPGESQLGGTVLVGLQGWPGGTVTVSVCGNGARRGTEDCNLVGSEAVPIRADGSGQTRLTVSAPPVGCPCVVRATTATSDVVRAAPLAIADVPGGVDLAPPAGAGAAADLMTTVRVTSGSEPWSHSWPAAFGGPAARRLVVVLENRGTTTMHDLDLVAKVSRSGQGGQPLDSRTLASLAPGERRVVEVPFTIDPPAYGDYVVTGEVYGLDSAVPFRAPLDNDPWALELLLVIALLVLAQIVRARRRSRARNEMARLEYGSKCSPEVSEPYGRRCAGDPYDRPRYEDTAISPSVASATAPHDDAERLARSG